MSTSDPADPAPATKWDAPALDGTADSGFLTASRLEELQKQAYDEAYEVGLREGREAGEGEMRRRADRFDELLVALARPFDRLDESVEKQLVELAMTVVRQLFRREIKMEPSHVIGVVRDAIKLLPAASQNVVVHLHPEDAALVRETLSLDDGDNAWSIVEDPLTARGGCKITTDNSQVDAQADTRVNAIINAISGDERQQ
jgi:flagellar assembly protein FliH